MTHPNARSFNHETGEVDLSEKQALFIDWLVDPTREGSQGEFARKNNVDPSTLSKWKKDLSFRAEWDRRLADLNVQPDRIQKVVEALFESATSGGNQSVKAAELYLKFVDRFIPKQIVETRGSAREMTDEEIASAAENVIALRRKA